MCTVMLDDPSSDSAQRVWRYIQERQWQPELDREVHPFPSSPEDARQSVRRHSPVSTPISLLDRRRHMAVRRWSQRRHPTWRRTEDVYKSDNVPHAYNGRVDCMRCSNHQAVCPSRFPSHHDSVAERGGAAAGQLSGGLELSNSGAGLGRRLSGLGRCLSQHGARSGVTLDDPACQSMSPQRGSIPTSVTPPNLADEIISASQRQLYLLQRQRRRMPVRSERLHSDSLSQQIVRPAFQEALNNDPSLDSHSPADTSRNLGCANSTVEIMRHHQPALETVRIHQPVAKSVQLPLNTVISSSSLRKVQPTSSQLHATKPRALAGVSRTQKGLTGSREMPRFSFLSPFGLGRSPPPTYCSGSSPGRQAPFGALPQQELSEEVLAPSDAVDCQSWAGTCAQSGRDCEHAGRGAELVAEASVPPNLSTFDETPVSDRCAASLCDTINITEHLEYELGAHDHQSVSQNVVYAEEDRLLESTASSQNRSVSAPERQPRTTEPQQNTSKQVTLTPKQKSVIGQREECFPKLRSIKEDAHVSSTMSEPETCEVSPRSGNLLVREIMVEKTASGNLCGSPLSTRKETLARKGISTESSLKTRICVSTRTSLNIVKGGIKSTMSSVATSTVARKRKASGGWWQVDQDDVQLIRPPLRPVFRDRHIKRVAVPGSQCAAADSLPEMANGCAPSHSFPRLRRHGTMSVSKSDQAASESIGECRPTILSYAVMADDPAITSLTAEHVDSVSRALQEPTASCVCLCLEHEDGGSQLRPATEGGTAAGRSPAIGLVATISGGPLDGWVFRLRPDCLPEDSVSALAASLLSGPGRRVCCGARDLLLFVLRRCGVPAVDGLRRWRLRDLAVADWLLGPDRPMRLFPALVAELGGQLGTVAARDATLSRQQQLATDVRHLAAADVIITQRLRSADLLTLFEHVETPLATVLAAMESHGLRVDTARLHAAAAACQRQLRRLEGAAYCAAGTVFSLASSTQLRRLLYDHLRLDMRAEVTVPLTVHGLKSTGEQALHRLAHTHPLPGLLLQHRRVLKLKSTYVDGVLTQVRGGAVFPHWLQTAAVTGRVQAAAPNLQSVPRRPLSMLNGADIGDKKVILARAPFVARSGQTLLSVDFCQMELRLLAHLSRDEHLTTAICGAPGGDIFRYLTALWTGRPAISVDDTQRERTKRLVYAAMYGAGRERLAEVLECSPQQAHDALDGFLASCPAIGAFGRQVVADCRKVGFVTSLLGRCRWVTAITSSHHQERSQAERQAINFVVQGSASDVCKLVMVAVTEAAPDVPLLAQLHDELLWEVPRARLAEFQALVECQVGRLDELLAAAGHRGPLLVPLPVTVSTGDCWADMEMKQSSVNRQLGPVCPGAADP